MESMIDIDQKFDKMWQMRRCNTGTFYDVMITRLKGCGMFKCQAVNVMEKVIATNDFDRWKDNVEGYSMRMVEAVWFGVKREALAWVDANFPKAWYRPMLEG